MQPPLGKGGRLQRAEILTLAVFLGTFCLSACGSRETSSVLLITVDTLRADRLSAYGYRLPTSPTVERLANDGVIFRNAFSGSACTGSSVTSILTGTYPSFHTVGLNNGHFKLDASTVTLAEILRDNGFRTGAIVANPVLRAEVGLDQGFETYDDDLEGHEVNRINTRERRADRVVDLAQEWFDVADDRPRFLWLHFQDPHGPYTPPEGWDRFGDRDFDHPDASLPVGADQSGYGAIPKYQVLGQERRIAEYERRYASEIAFFDAELDRLMAFLSSRELLASTLIVLTADHGEAFGEDGFYFGHSHSVGLDQVSVPLVVAGPGVPRGVTVRSPVSNVTVMVSILDLVGIEPPTDVVGPSLITMFSDPERGAPPVFFETPNQSGVVYGNEMLRHDRHAADDAAFWAAGNPNTGGYWRPLGRELVKPLDAGVERRQPSSERQLDELLAVFDRDALRARKELEGRRVLITRSDRLIERLRALGYVQ